MGGEGKFTWIGVHARFQKVGAFVQTALHLVVEGELLFVFLVHKEIGTMSYGVVNEGALDCCGAVSWLRWILTILRVLSATSGSASGRPVVRKHHSCFLQWISGCSSS